jgi:two-component system response regulator YesN
VYRLIVVDDESKHRRGLVNMIKKLKNNYEVFEARNGKEAFDLIMSKSIDILITDIKMPMQLCQQHWSRCQQFSFWQMKLIKAF